MAKAKRRAAKPSASRQVTVMVNGQVTGSAPATSNMLRVAKDVATARGITSFSLKINGKKVTSPDASRSLEGVRQLELVTKDARGG